MTLFLGYLHYRNSHTKPAPLEEVKRSKFVKYARIFIFDICLELIGFAFTVLEAIQIETYNWQNLNMAEIRVAFYLFQSLKYCLFIFCIYTEHFNEELDDKITFRLARLGIRADWKEILESLIFIPVVVIDGMLLNAELYTGDYGAVFTWDGIILFAIDLILWIKLCMRLLLAQYSSRGNPPYQVKWFSYALIVFFFSVFLVLLYIIVHLVAIRSTGMAVTPTMIIVLINALTHTYMCTYCAMMSPGIIMLDKALRGSEARIQQLKLFIRFLRIAPLPIFVTIAFFGYSAYMYASILTVSLYATFSLGENEVLQGLIYTVTILVDIWTCFFIANLAYALLKRIGGYFNIRRKFIVFTFPDCTSYSQQINAILGQCSANFRLDTRGQIQVTGGGRR